MLCIASPPSGGNHCRCNRLQCKCSDPPSGRGTCNSGLAAESPLITHVRRGNGGPTAAFPHCHPPRRGSGGFRWILRRRSECAVALKCHSEPPIAREKWPASFATVDRAKFSSPSTAHRQLE